MTDEGPLVGVGGAAAPAVLGVMGVLELRQGLGGILDPEVGDPGAPAQLPVPPQVRDQGVVGAEREPAAPRERLDQLRPFVRQPLELSVAVELVPEEVPEHQQAGAELRCHPRQPGLVELEQPLAAPLVQEGRCHPPVHVGAGAVVDRIAPGRPQDRGDHGGGGRLAVGRADHDRAALERLGEAVDGVGRHPQQDPARRGGAAAPAGEPAQSADGPGEAALDLEGACAGHARQVRSGTRRAASGSTAQPARRAAPAPYIGPMRRLTRPVPVLAACCALAACLAGAPAGAAPREAATAVPGKLSLRALRIAPDTARAGETFATLGKVRNRGERRRTAALNVYISRSGGILSSVGSRRLRVGGRSRRLFTITARVPGGAQEGSYRVTVCVARPGGAQRCRQAGRQLEVTAPGPPVLADSDGDGLPDDYDLCPSLAGVKALGGCPAPPPDRDGDGVLDDDDACPDLPGIPLYSGCPTPPPPPPTFVSGARTLGDPLFPEIGNGGYDALSYLIELDWSATGNTFQAGTKTTMVADALQNLSDFSLDLEGLTVSGVTVDGAAAAFTRVAPAACSEVPPAASCPATKLVVTPAAPINAGTNFQVEVSYTGQPQRHTDPDGSDEGWADTADGAFVVNEPIGAMTWFPSNNHPIDRATYGFELTVPTGKTAIGVGEQGAAPTDNGDGTTTWHWAEDDPTATYLTTATVGDFDLTASTTGFGLQLYDAIDSDFSPAEKILAGTSTSREGDVISFFSAGYGPYPFDSAGSVVDDSDVGYALEVQTKPHYPSAVVDPATLAHELSHQWFGDNVTLATWKDIWLNEGWAGWSEWNWSHEEDSSPVAPAQQFDSNYTPDPRSCPDGKWCQPPADPSADTLFSSFPTYTRGAMTLEALRQIVGTANFFDIAQAWQSDHAYGNGTTSQFISLAKQESGLSGADLVKLDAFFQQWLYGSTMPTITGANFFD